MTRLTLREALDCGRLEDFIAQTESEGIGPVGRDALDDALARVIKQPQSKDQTSHSPSRGGSSGK
jgi:hypothetical protein